MKRIQILLLTATLILCLAACGRSDRNDMSATSTMPNSGMTIMPNPTFDTNIPDPDVDTKMPIYTDGTDPTDASGFTGNGADNGK